MPRYRMRRLHHRRRHFRGAPRAEGGELRPGTSIIVVEAGDRLFDTKKRWQDRAAVAGLRREPVAGRRHRGSGGAPASSRGRWRSADRRCTGAASPIDSREEDLRLQSMYGLAVDWPIEWAELERFYCEAERRIGVVRRARAAARGPTIGAVSDGGDAAVVESARS